MTNPTNRPAAPAAPSLRPALLQVRLGVPLGLLACAFLPFVAAGAGGDITPGVVVWVVAAVATVVLLVPRRTRWLAVGMLLMVLLSPLLAVLGLTLMLAGSHAY